MGSDPIAFPSITAASYGSPVARRGTKVLRSFSKRKLKSSQGLGHDNSIQFAYARYQKVDEFQLLIDEFPEA